MSNIQTPVTEDELKAKATGRRVTLADVEAAIAHTSFFRAGHAADNAARMHQGPIPMFPDFQALQCLTFCVIVLKNGYTVTGQSACADPDNYNKEIGERIAREDAVKKIWPLLGFMLRDTMAAEQELLDARQVSMRDGFEVFIGTKVIHAAPMSRAVYNDFRGWTMPANEEDDEGYLVEYTDGGKPNVEGYAGYISWSPKDVFERSYRAVGAKASASETPAAGQAAGARDPEEKKPTRLQRLHTEFRELHERMRKLENFFQSELYGQLIAEEAEDLGDQYVAMVKYHAALSKRISRASESAVCDEDTVH